MSWIQNTHTLEVYRRYNAKQCKWFFFRGIEANVRKWEKTDIPICLRIINVNKSFSAIVYCHFDFRMPVSWKDDGQLRLTWNINKKTTTNEMSDIKSARKNTVKGFSINLLYTAAAVAMPIAIFELAFTAMRRKSSIVACVCIIVCQNYYKIPYVIMHFGIAMTKPRLQLWFPREWVMVCECLIPLLLLDFSK